jgi:hypothetical protein
MRKIFTDNIHIWVILAVAGVGFLLYKLYKKDPDTKQSILGK